MLHGAFLGAPKYLDRFVATPTMCGTCTLVHPCAGLVTWVATNPAAGSVTGVTFTPAVDFYGTTHCVGKCGDVRVLVSIWVVPDLVPKYCEYLPQVRLYTNQGDIDRQEPGMIPRPGAIDWDKNTDQLNLGWDPSAWSTPVKKTYTSLTYNFTTHQVSATVSGGAAPHRWTLFEKLSGTIHYIDRTPGATVISGGTSNTVVFQHPDLTTNRWVPMAGDQWDACLLPLP